MRDEPSLEQLLLDIFGGNEYHARAKEIHGDLSYQPIDIPLTVENLSSHLRGEIILGSYQILSSSDSVRWFGWDVDTPDLKIARDIVLRITQYLKHIPYAIEFSGSKGYHILVFLTRPMPAYEVKKIAEWIREKEELKAIGPTHVECFPKQERLSKDRPKGNLLKIPLGKHPKTHEFSRFVDPYNGWENGLTVNPIEILRYRASPEDVKAIMELAPNPLQQMVDLLSPYWTEGARHDLSLFLCGFLANEGWTIEVAKELIERICDASGDSERTNRLQTVITTFRRFRDGKIIRGRQGLLEALPAAVLQKITELSALIRSPNTVLQIDELRYAKGKSKIDTVRLAARTIWGILNDSGSKIFQTDNGRAFWYNIEEHTVIEEGIEVWHSVLNKMFGLNPVDTFSRMVYSELRLRLIRDAPTIPIRNRTFWSTEEKKLYINLGGPQVYIISGIGEIETSYNGECGQFFITDPYGQYTVPDFEAETVDVWDYLVNDLSFETSADAPASPDEQRELLKAWILSFFFQELMPTKPILALIGGPGSGKTTAMRRILKVLEGIQEDVLGIPTDKQDAFRSSIEGHRLLVMDNLEKSGAWWMLDMLNKLATGTHIEVRKLYHTNETHKIIPRCFVTLTAVSIPFSDETLFSRLLVLEMQRLTDPVPEHVLQRKIQTNAPMIWADLLRKLSILVDAFRTDKPVKAPSKSRLVDFTVFCSRIMDTPVVQGESLLQGLLAMTDSQMKQLRESSIAVLLLGEWISLRPGDASEWRSFVQLYDILQSMAHARRKNFPWKTSQALYRHFAVLDDRLRKEYQAEFKRSENNNSPVMVRFNTSMLLTD